MGKLWHGARREERARVGSARGEKGTRPGSAREEKGTRTGSLRGEGRPGRPGAGCGTDPCALRLAGVEKSFGARRVLTGVDLEVRPGQILGLLGRNGAGKSTLIGISCGLLAADAGSVSICGRSPAAAVTDGAVGWAPQDTGVYPRLTVAENLTLLAEVQGLSRRAARASVTEVMALLGLEGQARQRACELSGGQRRRLHAGMALVHHPRVVFLDEPTVGSDVSARRHILSAVRGLAERGVAVVYTTHCLGELEELGARIACLDQGRIVAEGSLGEFVAAWAAPSLRVAFAGGVLPAVAGWRAEAGALVRDCAASEARPALEALLAVPETRGLELADVSLCAASLERAYLGLVGEDGPATGPGAEGAARLGAARSVGSARLRAGREASHAA